MAPWQKAKQQWDRDCAATEGRWEDMLCRHLEHGVIYSTANLFVMCHEAAVNGSQSVNCWFVVMAAASGKKDWIKQLMNIVPHRHEYIAWRRNGEERVRVVAWDKLARKAGY
jgi:hypothetical protein